MLAFRAFNFCAIFAPSCVSNSLYGLVAVLALKLYFSFVDFWLVIVTHFVLTSLTAPCGDTHSLVERSG